MAPLCFFAFLCSPLGFFWSPWVALGFFGFLWVSLGLFVVLYIFVLIHLYCHCTKFCSDIAACSFDGLCDDNRSDIDSYCLSLLRSNTIKSKS